MKRFAVTLSFKNITNASRSFDTIKLLKVKHTVFKNVERAKRAESED